MAAEGNKKREKEPHQTEPEEEQQEEGQQRHPSSPSPSSSPPPPLVAAAESSVVVAGAAKSPYREGGGLAGKDETEQVSAKTASAPATPSGVSWLAEKAIVLVRFSECFRRGRVIRYDAELNMCVVQLDFTNTVVNKGIEDIFPDDPSIIAAATAAEALKREQKTPPAGSTRPPGFSSSDVPCPSSAPPFISSAPAIIQATELHSSPAVYSSGPSMKFPPIPMIHKRQPSPPQPLLPPLPPLPPPQHALLSPRTTYPPSFLPPAFSFTTSGSASTVSPTASSAACFQEALRLLYQKHAVPAESTRPPVSVPPFQPLPLHMLPKGHRKRYSTDEVEGPSRSVLATVGASTSAAAAASSTAMSQTFPRRQSESGLYRLTGRMHRHQPGEQMTLKRVRSEHQNLPFSMLGQQRPTGPPLALTMVLGEQMPVADPEQLARNLLLPLLNPSQSFQTAPAAASASTSAAATVTSGSTLHASRRTSALDLLLMTEGEARQLSETMLAGSSLAPSHSAGVGTTTATAERSAHLPTSLTSTLRSFSPSVSTSSAQVFTFACTTSTAATATTTDVTTPSTAYHVSPSSSVPASTSTSASTSEFQPGFRRSEAAKCRRVYGAVNKSRWCKQCRWKKACTRFQGPSPPQKDPPDLT